MMDTVKSIKDGHTVTVSEYDFVSHSP